MTRGIDKNPGAAPEEPRGVGRDPVAVVLERLAGRFCDVCSRVTEQVLADGPPAHDLRERLSLSCAYLLLHLVERDLGLRMPRQRVSLLVHHLTDLLACHIYGRLFRQDIVPANAKEYFTTFVEANYRLCAGQLILYPLPPADAGRWEDQPLLMAFCDWLVQSSVPEGQSAMTSRLLWESWCDNQRFSREMTSLKDSTLPPS